jgi:S1-C subfamily serine protease
LRSHRALGRSRRSVDIFRAIIDACQSAAVLAAGMGGGMIVRWLAVAIVFGWTSAAQAADWWWVGFSGTAPNRVVSYVDRESIRQVDGGITEVWSLAVGETPMPNGQQHQANHFAFKCRQRTFSALGRIALDPAWQRVPLMDPAPTAYAPVAAGSIGQSVMNLTCGHPSGNELHVDQPAQHALLYLRNLNGTASAAPAPQPAPEPQHQAENAGPSLGTGFFVDPGGHLITSFHVIAGADRIGCRTEDGVVHEATSRRAAPCVRATASSPSVMARPIISA